MGSMSIWHWLLVLVVVLLLFGRGRIPDIMGDFAKGIRSFKKGMAEDDDTPAAQLTTPPVAVPPVASTAPPVTAPDHKRA